MVFNVGAFPSYNSAQITLTHTLTQLRRSLAQLANEETDVVLGVRTSERWAKREDGGGKTLSACLAATSLMSPE